MWSLQDAKNKFSAVVDAALSGKPQEVSRRGRPAVVVISAESYRELVQRAGAERGAFVDHLLRLPLKEPGEANEARAVAQPRDVHF